MKIAVYSAHEFEIPFLREANDDGHELHFVSEKLNIQTVGQAKNCDVVAVFSSDEASKEVIAKLAEFGVELITTRSAGFNHIDLKSAKEWGVRVVHVPEYSPQAIAEHCMALLLALSRKLIPSYERIRTYDFSLRGLTGSEINKKTIGVLGTGNIGCSLIKILNGFGCTLLAYDAEVNDKVAEMKNVNYVELNEVFAQADAISLNLPLNEGTKHIIDSAAIEKMKNGVILINAGRGALVDTQAVIDGIKSEKIGGFGMDVYEHEKGFFYEDHSEEVFKDDLFARLLTFKNVVVTAHQAFLTETALKEIAETTMKNISDFAKGRIPENKIEHHQ
ncbi:D-lactate dehydrogenase [Croceitalea dokdonensis DOKDO 023]|uniref:D-lactate dehydrogenase n=1 Tax=Croceitalea dokdonensis DOKDO 023 TaxID=1300341 RepID=A0A0P7AJU2_9FLAO|nr:2-hydroxyacid dehydrogenase [Croceitalea dokdonensis]KPM32088.1 D-lactate dehydrogenase [Croceitalea dokdonensis DOKDO 023]